MLHAAYAQLPSSEQTRINNLLETALSGIHDADLLQLLKDYGITEPGQRDNELHSILGSEYPGLGPALEQYYSQYFSDGRSAVVAAARQFDQILAQEKSRINSLQNQLVQMNNQLKTDLKRRKISAYNHLVPQFNALVEQYNQTIQSYNGISRELLGEETPAASQ
jgi:hypothetical protein